MDTHSDITSKGEVPHLDVAAAGRERTVEVCGLGSWMDFSKHIIHRLVMPSSNVMLSVSKRATTSESGVEAVGNTTAKGDAIEAIPAEEEDTIADMGDTISALILWLDAPEMLPGCARPPCIRAVRPVRRGGNNVDAAGVMQEVGVVVL